MCVLCTWVPSQIPKVDSSWQSHSPMMNIVNNSQSSSPLLSVVPYTAIPLPWLDDWKQYSRQCTDPHATRSVQVVHEWQRHFLEVHVDWVPNDTDSHPTSMVQAVCPGGEGSGQKGWNSGKDDRGGIGRSPPQVKRTTRYREAGVSERGRRAVFWGFCHVFWGVSASGVYLV